MSLSVHACIITITDRNSEAATAVNELPSNWPENLLLTDASHVTIRFQNQTNKPRCFTAWSIPFLRYDSCIGLDLYGCLATISQKSDVHRKGRCCYFSGKRKPQNHVIQLEQPLNQTKQTNVDFFNECFIIHAL